MKSIIIYTTKYGSVEKAAKMLKSKMDGEVLLVNLMREKAPELSGYDTVILGGSVYAGSIQKALKNYISKNLPELQNKRLGLFICGAQTAPEEIQRELESNFPPGLYSRAAAKDSFGYEFDLSKLNFLYRIMIGKIAGVRESEFKLSEEKIESFAKAIAAV